MSDQTPVEAAPKMKVTPVEIRGMAARILIDKPDSFEQVLTYVTHPDGLAQHLQKEAFDCLDWCKNFSTGEKLHLWVETLSPRGKPLKHRHEYRKVVSGAERDQIPALLNELPRLVAQLKSAIEKQTLIGKVRIGLGWGVDLNAQNLPEFGRRALTEALALEREEREN